MWMGVLESDEHERERERERESQRWERALLCSIRRMNQVVKSPELTLQYLGFQLCAMHTQPPLLPCCDLYDLTGCHLSDSDPTCSP